MPTIRETLQAEIASAQELAASVQASIAAKQAKLTELEGTAGSFLNSEAEAVKAFVLSVWHHLGFGTELPIVPSEPTPPAA